MTMNSIAKVGAGGAGLSGAGEGSLHGSLTELQGLTFSLLAGAGAGAKNNLAAIRPEDTIVAALNNNAGTITDIKATTTISSVKAVGTVTLATAVAGNTATINGKTYTGVVGVPTGNTQFSVDTSDTAAAASLAAAVNAREALDLDAVTATSALGVVTITATADGTGGNAITLAKVGTPITVSGATLAGGTATGGIVTSGATNQVLLFWFNKR